MKYIKEYKLFKSETLSESNNITIVSTKEYVNVYYKENFSLGVCEISNINNCEWYINRVNIPDVLGKGKGVGSKILQIAIKEIIKKYDPKSIYVTPGGYGADSKKQFNFYKKNGFIEIPNEKEVLYYGDLAIPSR